MEVLNTYNTLQKLQKVLYTLNIKLLMYEWDLSNRPLTRDQRRRVQKKGQKILQVFAWNCNELKNCYEQSRRFV